MTIRNPFRRASAGALLILVLSGCAGGLSGSAPLAQGRLPASVPPVAPEQALPVARQRFLAGEWGEAARYYEQAVTRAPGDGAAWLGLAASYDRLRRFDLADQAYRQAAVVVGTRAEYFNNVGYSYLLRGDTRRAAQNFQRAAELQPGNLTIQNNIELMRSF
ncbi:tetratricopeptide repeat protein [Halodurantibacterium flavum]|uniref:Tetratricopeptide repeat protein n=1 Tax=Halodurantibacterium flavum TaxID=1382802 RepID=A0ABW4S622_9RHOB